LNDRLEGLKDFIHAKLNPPKTPPEHKSATNGDGAHDPKLAYLICDQQDYETVPPIEEYLFQWGFEVRSLAGISVTVAAAAFYNNPAANEELRK